MKALSHNSIGSIMKNLHDTKVVNLDASIRHLVEPISEVVHAGGGQELSLHVLCCNEYFLVTGLQGSNVDEIRSVAETVGNLLRTKLAGEK